MVFGDIPDFGGLERQTDRTWPRRHGRYLSRPANLHGRARSGPEGHSARVLGDDNIRRRFLREAQLAGEIDHENVALVHLRGQEGDSYFYAMQLVEGVDLDRLVKAKGPSMCAMP